MATAEKIVAGYTVRLDLSAEEARTLQAILGRVGGSTRNSPRKHANAIANAIEEATGVGTLTGTAEAACVRGMASVQFEDYA